MIGPAPSAAARRLRSTWRRLSAAVAPPPVILLYHRVANDPIDPWGLCVSPSNFAEQMAYIAAKRRPLPLADLVRSLERGRPPVGGVVVTFDDGYRDNLEAALPVLEAHGVPATVFCTAGAIGSEQGFWWDRLACALLAPDALPGMLALKDIPGEALTLGAAANYSDDERMADRRSQVERLDPSSGRMRLYRDVWSRLRPLVPSERERALRQIERWSASAGDGARAEAPLPLSREQASRLAASPWIEIGAHSVSHASLPGLSPEAQRDEVGRSRALLEALTGRGVRSFAYPFGDDSPATSAIVREAGFNVACSVAAGVVRRDADRLRLPRLVVGDWDAPTLARALSSLW